MFVNVIQRLFHLGVMILWKWSCWMRASLLSSSWKNGRKAGTSHDAKILKPWYWGRLQLDLMLLENQLPFFVIHKIYDTALSSSSIYPSFIDHVIHQFGYTDVQIIEDPNIVMQITHFLYLHRSYICQDCERQTERSPGIIRKMHSATQLAEVGIKFKAYNMD